MFLNVKIQSGVFCPECVCMTNACRLQGSGLTLRKALPRTRNAGCCSAHNYYALSQSPQVSKYTFLSQLPWYDRTKFSKVLEVRWYVALWDL